MVRPVTHQGPLRAAPPTAQHGKARSKQVNGPLRILIATSLVALAFLAVAGQLVRLAFHGQFQITTTLNQAIAESFARAEIVDRNGRLLAADVEAHSLFADPAHVLDRDEVVEKLSAIFPDLDQGQLRDDLSNRKRRFVWIKRGISPKTAQQVHNLGLPGLSFRRELRRVYPAGRLAGHVLGHVNVDNKGMSGIERYLDEVVGVEPVHGATLAERAPVRLSLDMGVQHAVDAELRDAMQRYKAKGAAGVVLDIETGEVLASASLPDVDPARPTMSLEPGRLDKVANSTFELGSVFKTVTAAMVLDGGLVTPETVFDVREPLTAGRFTIKDSHPVARPLTVAEIFIHSSNVGAGMMALKAGPERFKSFLKRLGLAEPMKTEAGPIAAPRLPERWGKAETITASYGHGIAVAPLQFATAVGALLNGGDRIVPTFVKRPMDDEKERTAVVSKETSNEVQALMRRNVTDRYGTGKRAAVQGYAVGGKTGTAEIPVTGGYREDAVIASFISAFPMNKPKYLVFVLLFEPEATDGEVLAALNAAPTAGRIIARIGPLLGVSSESDTAMGKSRAPFDAIASAKYETE